MKTLAKMFKIHIKAVIYGLILLFILASLTLTILSVDWFIEYSSLPVGLTKASVGILILALIDDVIFHEINTVQALKDKNIAYALVYLGNAIIVAACIGLA